MKELRILRSYGYIFNQSLNRVERYVETGAERSKLATSGKMTDVTDDTWKKSEKKLYENMHE